MACSIILPCDRNGWLKAKPTKQPKKHFGLLLPSVTIDTRYSEFSGNQLDLGDLINPAYAALNQITGQNRFPTNLSLTLPAKQETKLRLVQPILQPKALYGYRIRRNLKDAESAKLEAHSPRSGR